MNFTPVRHYAEMETVFYLRRHAEHVRKVGTRWNFSNRLTDAAGKTLYSGLTPNGFFKSPVEFTSESGDSAVVFGANRPVMPSVFCAKDGSGAELCRIELPVAARLRPNSSMQLIVAGHPGAMEIVPSHMASDNELNRIIAVFQEEFVIRRSDRTVAFTGELNPEDSQHNYARSTLQQAANDVVSDIANIPRNFIRMARGQRHDRAAARLSLEARMASPELALALLLFRTYIFSDLQHPEEAWWQAG